MTPTWMLVPAEPTEAMIAAGWIDKEDVNPDDIYRAMLAAAPPADIEALCAKVAELENENSRLLGKACLICGASQPCELNDDPYYSPCTFDPSPVDAAKAFLGRAEIAEAQLRAVVVAAGPMTTNIDFGADDETAKIRLGDLRALDRALTSPTAAREGE